MGVLKLFLVIFVFTNYFNHAYSKAVDLSDDAEEQTLLDTFSEILEKSSKISTRSIGGTKFTNNEIKKVVGMLGKLHPKIAKSLNAGAIKKKVEALSPNAKFLMKYIFDGLRQVQRNVNPKKMRSVLMKVLSEQSDLAAAIKKRFSKPNPDAKPAFRQLGNSPPGIVVTEEEIYLLMEKFKLPAIFKKLKVPLALAPKLIAGQINSLQPVTRVLIKGVIDKVLKIGGVSARIGPAITANTPVNKSDVIVPYNRPVNSPPVAADIPLDSPPIVAARAFDKLKVSVSAISKVIAKQLVALKPVVKSLAQAIASNVLNKGYTGGPTNPTVRGLDIQGSPPVASGNSPPVAADPSGNSPPVAADPSGDSPPVAADPSGDSPPVAADPSDNSPPVAADPSGDSLPTARADSSVDSPPIAADSPDNSPPVEADSSGDSPPVAADSPGDSPPVAADSTGDSPPVAAYLPDNSPPVAADSPDNSPPVSADSPDNSPPVAADSPDNSPPVAADSPNNSPPAAGDGYDTGAMSASLGTGKSLLSSVAKFLHNELAIAPNIQKPGSRSFKSKLSNPMEVMKLIMKILPDCKVLVKAAKDGDPMKALPSLIKIIEACQKFFA